MPLYLSRYIGDGTLKAPFIPFGSDRKEWAAIDLRPDGGATLDGGGLNACLLWSPHAITGLELLGHDQREPLALATRKNLDSRLRMKTDGTLRDAVMRLMLRPPPRAWNPASGEIWLGDNWGISAPRNIKKRLASDSFRRRLKLDWLKYAAALIAAVGFPFGSILASDSFDRADLNNLGANWTADAGSNLFEISSNEAHINTDVRAFYINHYNAISWPNDQYSKIIIGTASTVNDEGLGPATRSTVVANGQNYLVQPNTSRSRMFKNLSASYTQLGSDGAAFANGNTCELDSSGTSISTLKNGSSVIGPITDSAIATGNAAMHGYGHGTAASWEGGDFSVVASMPPWPLFAHQPHLMH